MHPLPCFFALLLLLLLLLFADAHSENLIEQVIHPVHQPFDNNTLITRSLYTIETEIIAAKYTYLMELNVTVKTSGGDKSIKTYAIPDTGSELIWLNANDCVGNACHCSSSSSKTKTTTTDQPNCIEKPNPEQLITCKDQKFCKALESLKIKTCSSSGQCGYDVTFPDGLSTHGVLGTGNFSFPNINSKEPDFVKDIITFGVSNKTDAKDHFEQKSVGVVGLGFGTLSLLKQLSKIDRKFSYCLPNPESSRNHKSKIKFGNKVATSDKPSTTTDLLPMEEGDPCKDRYCVHLATISVHDPKNKIKVSQHTNNGVMVIDSGSTFTYLVGGLFNEFLKKVKLVIGEPIKTEVKPYHNCFEESAVDKKLEKVWFEFGDSGTTEIELKRENFFDNPSYKGNKYFCLTVGDGDEKKLNKHLLGNRAQMDFWVAFDLSTEHKKVSFDHREKYCDE